MIRNVAFHRPFFDEDEINQVTDAIRSGWWTIGPKTRQFETEFSKYIGVNDSVAASSWTAAAHLALEAIGLKEGDEVILPAFTFTATAEIVRYFNAVPVLADIDPVTMNISPEAIARKITPKTKAIIPVHYGGLPADLDAIYDIAKANNLRVIEDAAHALPTRYKGKMIGSFGDIVCFSFYVTKTLATGDGGMISTNDEAVIERARVMRLHGMSRDAWERYSKTGSWYYDVVAPGFKYNMTELEAGLGIAQLKKVDELFRIRKEIAARYDEAFSKQEFAVLPPKVEGSESSYHLYPLRLRQEALTINRAEFVEKLKDRGIVCGVHFIPLYRFTYYKELLDCNPADYPSTEKTFEGIFSIPIFPGMSNEDQQYVIDTILAIGKNHRR